MSGQQPYQIEHHSIPHSATTKVFGHILILYQLLNVIIQATNLKTLEKDKLFNLKKKCLVNTKKNYWNYFTKYLTLGVIMLSTCCLSVHQGSLCKLSIIQNKNYMDTKKTRIYFYRQQLKLSKRQELPILLDIIEDY